MDGIWLACVIKNLYFFKTLHFCVQYILVKICLILLLKVKATAEHCVIPTVAVETLPFDCLLYEIKCCNS